MTQGQLTDIDGVRLYRAEELHDLLDRAIEMGLPLDDMGEVTIAQLDEMVNGSAN